MIIDNDDYKCDIIIPLLLSPRACVWVCLRVDEII